jgi:hypothetical protein
MATECKPNQLEFEGMGRRRLVASFDGGHITSDGGVLLLHETARRTSLLRRFAACFRDHRDPTRIEHSAEELLAQRVLGIACGYEDLNDHATLRYDPLLAAAVGKKDALGKHRRAAKDTGKALASPATLNRLELTPKGANASSRYCKIEYDAAAIEDLFVQVFLDAHAKPPEQIVLDLDATDDPLHGKQEGRFFHGYYRNYCYLPLYIFCGEHLLCAKLRMANADASDGALEEVQRIVARIRERWPKVEIVLRADSGFARDAIMSWAEENGVHYVFGLARNRRLERMIADEMAAVRAEHEQSGVAVRRFCELRYQTQDSWTRERRVVAKVEYLPGKANPRFVVTSLAEAIDARALYEDIYCARGDMENRIKEQQLWLFADRTSAHTMRANQLRLWFSSVAYVLLNALRQFGLAGTELERAQVGTIRVKLIKLGAVVTVSVRRIMVALSQASPVQVLFGRILLHLRQRLPSSA